MAGQTFRPPEKFLPVFNERFGAEGVTTTSTSYITVADSDICVNSNSFKKNGNLWLKFMVHINNNAAGGTTSVQMYRQNAASVVSGTELTVVGSAWGKTATTWLDWSAEANQFESYQIQMKASSGTAECNSAIMILSPIQF